MDTKKTLHLTCVALVTAALLFLPGCGCWEQAEQETRFLGPPVEAEPVAAMPPRDACAMQTLSVTQAYPMQSVLKVEKQAPENVFLNNAFEYDITVTNLSDEPVHNVAVHDSLPENLKIERSQPQWLEAAQGRAQWNLGTLAPQESRTVNVTAMATGPASIASCVDVTYDKPLCAAINVMQPQGQLRLVAPDQVLTCDNIPLRYTLTNSGNAPLCDVSLQHAIQGEGHTEKGFAMPADDTTMASLQTPTTIDLLQPGQSREFETILSPRTSGEYTITAMAESVQGLKLESNTVTVNVQQPSLEISADAPEMRYVGRNTTHDIRLVNNGPVEVRDARVTADLPANVTFVNATDGGSLIARQVVWEFPSIAAGQKRNLSFTVMPQSIGRVDATVTAEGHCAKGVSASAATEIRGIAALLLEVVDVNDPIEINADGSYLITVTNQGSATTSDITVTCQLPAAMNYLSSSGPSLGRFREGALTFQPLRSLAPGQTASWRVMVKARQSGEAQIMVKMTCKELSTPMTETEVTTLYE